MHGGFERGHADHGVLDGNGLDLQLEVPMPHRLRNEREAEDGDKRVRPQVRSLAYAGRQPVFRVDAGPEVDADGTEDDDAQDDRGCSESDQHLAHPHIVAYRPD